MTLARSQRNKQAVSMARRNNIDAAPAPGKMLMYAGPCPATGAAVTLLLATITLSMSCGTVDEVQLYPGSFVSLVFATPAEGG